MHLNWLKKTKTKLNMKDVTFGIIVAGRIREGRGRGAGRDPPHQT